MLVHYLAFHRLFSIGLVLVAASGFSGDWKLHVVRRCADTTKGLSLCHKQSEANECCFAGMENRERGQEAFNDTKTEQAPAKSHRQGL